MSTSSSQSFFSNNFIESKASVAHRICYLSKVSSKAAAQEAFEKWIRQQMDEGNISTSCQGSLRKEDEARYIPVLSGSK